MTTTTRDLIDAIQAGKSAMIQSTFASIMAEKTQRAIESYRAAVIDSTFNESTEPKDADESSADSSIDEELDLSEYSLEEIQEFMESEDFAALDELSKNTLASYAKKSTSLGLQHAYIAGSGSGDANKKDFKTAVKRQRGINAAIRKLAK